VSNVEAILNEDDTGEQDEFQPDAMEVDDETTMEAEERLGREMSHEQEMSLLQQEGEIPIEQLRAMYAQMSNDSDDSLSSEPDSHSQASADSEGQSLQDLLEHDNGDEGTEEFRPDVVAEVDDETTMEAEERLGRDMSYQDELNLLKRESEMSVEELRLMYAGAQDTQSEDDGDSLDESILDEDDQGSEDEFRPTVDAVDDETTIEVEESLGREMSVEDEIALLQKEGETPVSDLRAMYEQAEDDEGDTASSDQCMSVDDDKAEQGRLGRKRSRPDADDSDDDDDGETAMRKLEVAEEKARMTRATRPFLIAPWVKLREYQQIGLNWLVSIQTRRLNAILADEMVSLVHAGIVVSCLQTRPILTILRSPSTKGPGEDVADDCTPLLSCRVQRHLGSSPHCRAYVVYRELGNGVQALRPRTEGAMLLWIGKASKGASLWVDKGSLCHIDAIHACAFLDLTVYLSLFPGELAPCDCDFLSVSGSGFVCFQAKEVVLFDLG
jgi:hypothetical protein